MRGLTAIIMFILVSGGCFAAWAESCQNKITFLPQTHQSPTGNTSGDVAAIDSQLQILRYLKAHQGLAVFSEQAGHNTLWSEMPDIAHQNTIEQMNEEFPDSNIPSSFATATARQREHVLSGAEYIALYLQFTPGVYAVAASDAALQDLTQQALSYARSHPNISSIDEIPADERQIIYVNRERAALEQINNYFKTHQDQHEVALVYGSIHNFTFYPDLFPAECISIPDEFKEAWLGRTRLY